MNKRFVRCLSLAVVLCAGTLACDGGDGDEGGGACDRSSTILGLGTDEANGATVFANTCGSSGCHGADGISGSAPSLATEIPEHNSDELACILLAGEGSMPSQAHLSDQDLADVIAYVEATFQ